MPRVTVTVHAVDGEDANARVLLDEPVQGFDLEDEQSSVQFLERLAWAIEEGEKLEFVGSSSAIATARCASSG